MSTLTSRLSWLSDFVEANRPEEISRVGYEMAVAMAVYHRSPTFYRRRRAECLHTAVLFMVLGHQTGRDFSSTIKFHLGRAIEWRRLEKPAPLARRQAA